MWTVRIKREKSEILVPEYQKQIIRKLLTTKDTMSSGDMWRYLQEIMPEIKPSRASVIFFLNDLVKYEYADYNESSGKGGFHRNYFTKLTKHEFEMKIKEDINEKLDSATDAIFRTH